MRLTEQQRRVINENPHLQAGKIADFLGLSVNTVGSYRKRNIKRKWTYTGVGIPFLRYDRHIGYRVKYKMIHLYGGSFSGAITWQGQLLWLLERGLCPFGLDGQPVIEHPYFESLKL